MKIYTTFFLLIMLSYSASAQMTDTVFYSSYEVILKGDLKKKAAFYELNNGKNRNGLVIRYYLDHSKYGEVLYTENLKAGPYVIYYKNGNVKQRGFYARNIESGTLQRWYSNGEKRSVIEYSQNRTQLMIDAWDSFGKRMVENGNGHYNNTDFDSEGRRKQGEYKDGLMVGEWKNFRNDTLISQDKYDSKGSLISGRSFDKEGNEYKYTELEELASFPGAQRGWTRHLKKNLKYPKEALRKRIQGRVFLSFVVNKDGSIDNIEVIRGVGGGIDEEATRVLKASPNWIPGKQRGQTVKSRMSIQILFRL